MATIDLSNYTVVITGSNAGLGLQLALRLVELDANIVMACRNIEKARQSSNKLLARNPNARITILPLDVSDPDSIEAFAYQFRNEVGQLHILINNAGIVTPTLLRNANGHEMHLATNYLGAFMLTGLLLPCFGASETSRIINVGSLANRFGEFDFNDPNWEYTKFNHWKAYGRSKIAIAAFTMELNRRLRARSSNTIALSAHPGFANTEMGAKNGAMTPKNVISKWLHGLINPFVPSPEEAAEPLVYATTSRCVAGGDYYGPTGFLEIQGKVGKAKIRPVINNTEFGRNLWDLSERLTGFRYL